jgi:FkbM family methyltransferase
MNLISPPIWLRNYYRSRLYKKLPEIQSEDLQSSAIVFSPHQDDETLGCGGTIMRKKQAGAVVKLVFMTDGSRSHHRFIPELELKSLRQQEALSASSRLGLPASEVIFWDYRDGELNNSFRQAVEQTKDLLTQEKPQQVFIPYYRETHPDHYATNRIVTTALTEIFNRDVTIYEYPVWYWHHFPWTSASGDRRSQQWDYFKASLKAAFGWQIVKEFNSRVDISDLQQSKRDALDQHQTQMTRLVADDGWGTLHDVSNGEWLECFFQTNEIFRCSQIPIRGKNPMLKQIAVQTMPLLPTGILEKLAQNKPSSTAYRLANLGLKNRDLIIKHGVAKGLKFNIGESCPDFALGTYELPIQEALAKYLNPGDVFYDLGANVGFLTIVAAKLVGATGQVYAFEPSDRNIASIRHNAQINGFNQVEVIPKAVSHTSGVGELLLAEYSGGNTLSTNSAPPDLAGSIEVDLVAIDDLVAENTIAPPKLIKIDVEGAELDALKGMTQTIKTHQPAIIYEIDDGEQESFQEKNQAIETFIQSLGYKITPLAASYQNIDWQVGHAIATPL